MSGSAAYSIISLIFRDITASVWSFVSLCSGYVGAATVGAAAWWFTVSEDGPQVTLYQLVSLPTQRITCIRSLPPLYSPTSLPAEPFPPVCPRQPRLWWSGLPRVRVALPNDHGPVCARHHRDVQCSQQVNRWRSYPLSAKGILYCRVTVCFISLAQSVGEPVSAADASLGEHLAAGGHLPLHVSSLPHPIRGASACKCSRKPTDHFATLRSQLLQNLFTGGSRRQQLSGSVCPLVVIRPHCRHV